MLFSTHCFNHTNRFLVYLSVMFGMLIGCDGFIYKVFLRLNIYKNKQTSK